MAFQTIVITNQWGPVTTDVRALDINQLGELIARQLSGTIRADVSFYLEVLFDPTSFVTNLIFNSQQRVFKAWSTATGSYVPLTQYQVGDVKNSYVGQDQISVGWVLLDGRAITAIPGLSGAQQTALETFFGIGGNLPTVTPSNTQNLPGADAFSGITKPTVNPADGVIGALPVSAGYTQSEVEGLRDATETLRDSTGAVEIQAAAIQDKCGELLTALRDGTTPQLFSLIFAGFA